MKNKKEMMKNNYDFSPADKPDYDYKMNVRTMDTMDLKVSKDSVPTWSSMDMNEAKIKAVSTPDY
jgi:hypothetical protein